MPQSDYLSSDWFVQLAGAPASQRRIICFPNAGGSATAFKPWASQIPSDIALFAAQFPGRQNRIRENPICNLHIAVESMMSAVAALSGPNTIFFGDCTGALVAYEVVRTSAERGIPLPRHFLISCCRAPGLQPRHQLLHTLDESALIAQIRYLALAPVWLLYDTATLREFLPLLRCDFELAESYVHWTGTPLPVPITAVAGTRDKITPEKDVIAWQRYTMSHFNFVTMEGSHNLALTRVSDIMALVKAAMEDGHGG